MTVETTVECRRARGFLARVAPSWYDVVARGGPERDHPTVSVVVPTYQRAQMVADTIEALQSQDFSPEAFEIIVVDNASGDGTPEVFRRAAHRSPVPFTGVRMRKNRGPAWSRNVGAVLSRGAFLAFTDSDCVPVRGWLRSLIHRFSDDVGVVQGRTAAHPDQPQPLFNHFIETHRLDGSFSTSNVCYRRAAFEAAGGFDPACKYWEDVDLGWRVRRLGWRARFASDALVYHQVIRLTALQWLRHAANFGNWPAKVARYPEFRRYLFARLWADPWQPLFQAALVGVGLSPMRREFLLLTVPYLAAFPLRGRLAGRKPLLRAAANIARDAVSFTALVAGSIRYRRVVL